MAESAPKVLGVLITYRPDPDMLRAVLPQALGAVDRLVIVDNLSTEESRAAIVRAIESGRGPPGGRRASMELIRNERNTGVSVAFNQGIDRALEGGYDFVFLLDQDSIVRDDAVRTLLEEYTTLGRRFRVGALQARNVEADGRVNLDSRRRDYYRRHGAYDGATAYQGLLLLNSGTLFPTDVFRAVGTLNERFFADFVDYEFSLRLASRGYQVFHVPAARIDHNIGPPESPSPKRLYYAVRELVPLLAAYGRRYPGGVAPIVWTTASRAASLTVRSGHPLRILGLTLRGVFDGLLGVSGEFKGSLSLGRP
jgi:rhamnosyltransferase